MSEEKNIRRLGLSVIAAGLATNPFFLGYVFSPNARIHSISLILCILVIQVLLISAGILLFVKRKTISGKNVFFSAVTVGIVILAIELGLHLLHAIIYGVSPANIRNRASLSIYKNKEWAEPLLEETNNLQMEYDQYRGWKTKEFHGKYINVDNDGIRRTYNPEYISDTTETVYVFGGSTVWGSYVRDEGTIPSLLSRKLRRQSHRFEVYNYGERGYTFTQNVVHLVLLLRSGHVPNYVIFYEGANDVMSAYYTGHAETNGLDFELAKAFVWKQQPFLKQIGLLWKESLEQHSMMYIGIKKLSILLFGETQPTWAAKNYDNPELAELAVGIRDNCVATLDFVQRLSATYHFSYVFVLQPVLLTKIHPTDEEQRVDVITKDQKLKMLYQDTYRALSNSSLHHFYDISNIFDDTQETVYSDYCHLSEEGDEKVADKLSEIVFPAPQ